MTIAELQRVSDRGELDAMLKGMPIPSYKEAANTETETLEEILGGFGKYTTRMTEADQEALRKSLAKYA